MRGTRGYTVGMALVSAVVAAGCSSSSGNATGSDGGSDAGHHGADAADGAVGKDAPGPEGGDAAAGPDWSCIGKVKLPPAGGAKGTYSATFVDGLTKAGVAGITVNACAKSDATCASPVATGTTDSKGKVTVSNVPLGTKGFDGYLDAQGGGIAPTLVFRSIPLADTTGDFTFPVLSTAEITTAGSGLGVTIDPKRGQVAVGVLDCAGKFASGAEVSASSADKSSREFYYVFGLPSKTATATDTSGSAVILDVPVGDATLSAKIQATSAVVATLSVPVRAGGVTEVYILPAP